MMKGQYPDLFFELKKQEIDTNIYSNLCQIKFLVLQLKDSRFVIPGFSGFSFLTRAKDGIEFRIS